MMMMMIGKPLICRRETNKPLYQYLDWLRLYSKSMAVAGTTYIEIISTTSFLVPQALVCCYNQSVSFESQFVSFSSAATINQFLLNPNSSAFRHHALRTVDGFPIHNNRLYLVPNELIHMFQMFSLQVIKLFLSIVNLDKKYIPIKRKTSNYEETWEGIHHI